MLVDVGVDEEVLQRALEAGDAALEHGEARAAQLGRALLVGVRARLKGQGQGQGQGRSEGYGGALHVDPSQRGAHVVVP